MALVVALLSPVAAISDVLFSVHMTQHEILILVAAPLLVLGRPIVPFLWALSPRWRVRLGKWSHKSFWGAARKKPTGPLGVWVLPRAALLGPPLPAASPAALARPPAAAWEKATARHR